MCSLLYHNYRVFKIRSCESMKKSATVTIAFAISLLPMLLNQYGGSRGVQEISGLINLYNPIGMLSIILFAVGVWVPFKRQSAGFILGACGTVGIVTSEIYEFFTWHVMTITGRVSVRNSLMLAFPEFYIGLIVSLIMVAFYFIVNKKAK